MILDGKLSNVETRADFLGLSLFKKIILHETRPLVRKFMPKYYDKKRPGRVLIPYPVHTRKFNNSFFPYFTRKYNLLENNFQSEMDICLYKYKLKIKLKPKKIKHWARGSKEGNKFLTHIRVGHSALNSHTYAVGLTNTDLCKCNKKETVSHFLTECVDFLPLREELYLNIERLLPSFRKLSTKKKVEILLYGLNLNNDEPDCRNIPLTFAVQKYILKTRRFQTSNFF